MCAEHRARSSARSAGHGATVDDRERLLDQQGSRCPICTLPLSIWDSVDDDHGTGAIRGLLHPDLGGHPKPATEGQVKTGHHE